MFVCFNKNKLLVAQLGFYDILTKLASDSVAVAVYHY